MQAATSPPGRPLGGTSDPQPEERPRWAGALRAPELRRRETDELWRLLPIDREAVTEELVRRFLPLARRLAGRYRNPNEPQEDLVQVASVGLLRAIGRFDPDRGASFPAFAVPTVLGELRRHFRSTGWAAHVARGGQELAQRVDIAARELTERVGRPPRLNDLAEHTGLEVEAVVRGLVASGAHYASSLDTPLADDSEGGTLVDTVGGEDQAFSLRETMIDLGRGIARIPAQERRALSLRALLGLKQREIADEMHCSQMQVSRLLRRAEARLASGL